MALDPNSKYLRQITTGDIFGYCEEFAKRSDMVPYNPATQVAGIEEITVDLRTPPPEAVASTPDAFSGRGGVMGALLGDG